MKRVAAGRSRQSDGVDRILGLRVRPWWAVAIASAAHALVLCISAPSYACGGDCDDNL